MDADEMRRMCNRVDAAYAYSVIDDPTVARIQALRKAGTADAIVFSHAAQILAVMNMLGLAALKAGVIGVRHLEQVWRVRNAYAAQLTEPDEAGQAIMDMEQFNRYLEKHAVDCISAREEGPTAKELGEYLCEVIARDFPTPFAEGEKAAAEERSATKGSVTTLGGTAELSRWTLNMPKDQSQRMWEAVTKKAKVLAGELDCDLAQARMDVIAGLISGEETNTVVHVHVFRWEGGPGFIPGVGAISTEQADVYESFAKRVDSVTVPPAVEQYTPSREMKEFLIGRDGTCRFPGCEHPAPMCDKDHIVPYNHTDPSAGGATDVRNMQCLCRAHHNLKTNGQWKASTSDGGWTIKWVNHHGEQFTTHARGVIPKPQ